MYSHRPLNLILALILLPAVIIFPTQPVTLTATNPPFPETNLPEALQNIPGATTAWWAAVQEELHMPGYHATRHMAGISGLSLVPNWLDEGDQANAEFGYAVSTAGDVNGDGYGDVIVGAPDYSNPETGEGAAAVYYGSATGLSPVPNWMEESDQAYASFGTSVSTAGDVNGDGYDDVLIGAPYYQNGQWEEGAAAVYYGSSTGLSHVPNWIDEGDQAGASFGFSVGTAGDANGDGYDDVIIGAPYYSNLETDEGAAAAYYGSAVGLSLVPSWIAYGNQESAEFGFSVGTAGDVNGDGYDDVIIGLPSYDHGQTNEGAAAVYHGSTTGFSPVPNWMDESDQGSAQYGYSVGTAGDVNGDGYDDVIIGSPSYDHGQSNEGATVAYYGSTTGLSLVPNWMGEGDQIDAEFGYSVGKAGDVNGDGYDDIVIGSPSYDHGQTNEGAAVAYIGSASGLSPSPDWMDEGDQAYASFGYSVGAAGDVNGDGCDDVIIGSPAYDHGQTNEGAAAVYHGSADYSNFYLPLVVRKP